MSMNRFGPAQRHNRRNTDARAGAPGNHASVNNAACSRSDASESGNTRKCVTRPSGAVYVQVIGTSTIGMPAHAARVMISVSYAYRPARAFGSLASG
jgi:hypothetical protein